MKKLIALLLICLPAAGHADTKISAMTSTNTVSGSEIIPIVVSPSLNPANRVITVNNFTNSLSSVTISNTSGLPLKLNQPTLGSTSEGISFSNAGAQVGYLIQDNYSSLCSDFSTSCQSGALELGNTSSSHYFFNSDGRLFTSQGNLLQNAFSSVFGGSLIVGGTGNKNYTDTQNIGDGNLLVNNGILASSITVQGSGDGQITLTIAGSTYTVTSSSTPASWTTGHGLMITGPNTIGDSGSTPGSGGGSSGASTINTGLSGQLASYTLNGTSISAVSNTNVWASSVTVSTFGVIVGATKTSNVGFSGTSGPGALDVWMAGAFTNKTLFDVGSTALADQFYVPNNHYAFVALGIQAGQLIVGDTGASGQRIYSNGDNNNFFDLRNGSSATINTGTANGPGDVRVQPASKLTLTVSNVVTTGVTASSMTVQGYFQIPPRTKAQIGAITPTVTDGNGSALGETYYCSDCATVALCVSTGTAQGAFALTTNKGSACQ